MARVLVVDDSQVSREILKEMLADGGHTVIGEACNGDEGVSKFKELHPDITTLDITMPVLGGIDALKEIMEIEPDAKVIMVSSSAQNSKVVEAMMFGASDFLAKPLEADELLECIENLADYE